MNNSSSAAAVVYGIFCAGLVAATVALEVKAHKIRKDRIARIAKQLDDQRFAEAKVLHNVEVVA
ncbi:hypothetical protein pEaSNUABM37_00138 [Erwinia phage pEa_SNUABM_37]|nr:hypothetical protein pEaSNUABM37_00138 [Erwinia phage pEa_SNUABM_37]QXO10608.1 hypothetical protein pEaSNUABM48_00138 [Erwinia phage pEa_SNUABM_48]